GWEAAWALLVLITVRKCHDRRERLAAQSRDLRREAGDEVVWALADREPTPEEAALLTETLTLWLDALSPIDRSIVELGLLQGHDDFEVGRRLRRSQRTLRRVRRRAEDQLRAVCQHEEAPHASAPQA